MAGAGVPHSAAIVGAGAVGTTLGGRLLEAGWEVRYASRDPQHSRKLRDALRRQPGASGGGIAEAVQWAGGGGAQGAVLLTVPGSALASDAACAELAAGLGPAAAGATVIDATNPLDRHGNELCWARGRSSAEALQEALPGSFVYKALNTVGVEHMARPEGALSTEGSHRPTLMFAGPAERRERVAALVAAVGFGPVWVGNLRHARNLEALAELYIHLGAGIEGPDWSAPDGTRPYHFQVLRGGGSGESQG
ncbi:NADPH-dependent F420 reductase [Micractinium conductrix]|uniref:NADPH-dependent F420 reductase n=1 Tax=Micractinium conductrix TaxID=554055 RepID=A0A2P6V2D5_9CHLO|nr:NADPH-dependent F420 reductase [Micractinium conductrix]|eukprot:PSC68258.1 NADPH-dependent F420 reductase [Micractinium conductrix]